MEPHQQQGETQKSTSTMHARTQLRTMHKPGSAHARRRHLYTQLALRALCMRAPLRARRVRSRYVIDFARLRVVVLSLLGLVEQRLGEARDDTFFARDEFLCFVVLGADHAVGLARTGLTVGEDAKVVTWKGDKQK